MHVWMHCLDRPRDESETVPDFDSHMGLPPNPSPTRHPYSHITLPHPSSPFPRPFPAFPRLSRFPYVACEVLCTEVGLVLDQVINAHMVAVFSILDTSEAINPRLAGYFDKVSKRVVSWTITTHVCSSDSNTSNAPPPPPAINHEHPLLIVSPPFQPSFLPFPLHPLGDPNPASAQPRCGPRIRKRAPGTTAASGIPHALHVGGAGPDEAAQG